ncbi:hypothetical protein DFS34DRAFT_605345 [Phlyctochytrium arcticum]|nr:hypothetical protein DFS34DRAFT_605345 [Phlyctochytrium arcticum]
MSHEVLPPLPIPGHRHIIIGIDSITKHGVQSSPVLLWAFRQFVAKGDSVTVVHASKQLDPATAGHSGHTNSMTPEMLKGLERDVEVLVRSMTSHVVLHGQPGAAEAVTVKAHIAKGDPRETIKTLAMESNATAVIVGRRGSVGAVKRALLGSVSDFLCRELDCTVVIVKQ